MITHINKSGIAAKQLEFKKMDKEELEKELIAAYQQIEGLACANETLCAELVIAKKEIADQNQEREDRDTEFIVAQEELTIQNQEKEKRAAELSIANKELIFQNSEKEKRATELSEAKQHITDLNVGLEEKILKRTAQLEAANKELESFSYSVSHDLRAPLRAINGFTQILVEDYLQHLDDDAKEVMDEIISNSKRMGELIDNLLEFSRIGKLDISVVEVSMDELVKSILIEVQGAAPKEKINLAVTPLINCKGDRNMLKQVFLNLISNAFKYSGKKETATISIGCVEEKDDITYYVKDNGAGFDMQYYEKLFGVFQRLHSNNEFEGTGVGLAIVQRIISKHRGKVWAEGKVNEGACFYISLPKISKQHDYE